MTTPGHLTTRPVSARASTGTRIGLGATAVAIVAMAIDHMLDQGGGLAADPPMFLISCVATIALAAYLFGRVVPRALADAQPEERAARLALRLAALSVLSLPAIWIGLPFVLAGAAFAVALAGRRARRPARALTALGIAALVTAAGTATYIDQAVSKLA